MVRRGLVFSYYFPPEGGGGVQRWTKFIKYLSMRGWQFNVLTKKPKTNVVTDDNLMNDLPQSLKILHVGDLLTESFKIKSTYLTRWLSAFLYVTDSKKNWNNSIWDAVVEELENNKYDIIICTIPPYSLSEISRKIAEKYTHIPVVTDMRDPWSINPYKIHPTRLHAFLDRKNEFENLNKIKNFVYAYKTTLDFHLKFLKQNDNKKSIVIPNGYDEPDFSIMETVENRTQKEFHIGFSGTFYSHLNNPKNLFKAIAYLKTQNKKIYFHHVGESVYSIEKLAAKYDIEDQVKIWGYKSHQECLKILAGMNALVVILDPHVKNAEKTAGGKLYEYLRFKKPILGLVPDGGEAADVIRGTNSGIVCADTDPVTISEAILNLKKDTYKFEGIDKYSRENQARQLQAFLESIINTNNEHKH